MANNGRTHHFQKLLQLLTRRLDAGAAAESGEAPGAPLVGSELANALYLARLLLKHAVEHAPPATLAALLSDVDADGGAAGSGAGSPSPLGGGTLLAAFLEAAFRLLEVDPPSRWAYLAQVRGPPDPTPGLLRAAAAAPRPLRRRAMHPCPLHPGCRLRP